MAWYHQYQFAELKFATHPKLRNKSFPIIRYEIRDDPKEVLRVQLQIGVKVFEWFDKYQVTLFKGGKDLIIVPEQKRNVSIFKKILKSLHLKEF